MPILVVVIVALGIGFYALSHTKKEVGGNWVSFFAKGKETGFTFKEIETLRNLAVQCNLDDPVSLFWSQEHLDACIHSFVRALRMSGESEDQGTQDFLSKLYDFRKKLEMEKPHIKHGITNSRQIGEGQNLRVLVPGTGVFKSQVVKNTSQYMTISRPVNNKNSSAHTWQGSRISVYFWRDDDAGYVFDSDVEDEIFSKGVSSLKISHSESLFRTQKRKSVRMKMQKAAFLYLASDDDPPHRLEIDPGLKCFLEDLSDSGCAVTVGGKADSGLRVKVQFALENTPISMTGVVRSTSYREDTDRSVLHIESEALPLETRNHILGEVFGMITVQDDDELPFRVLDDEAASFDAKGSDGSNEPGDSSADADDGQDAAGI